MTSTKLKRLAVLGWIAAVGTIHATHSFSADIRLDATMNTAEKNSSGTAVDASNRQSNQLFISRARFDLQGPLETTWKYFAQVGLSEYENYQLGIIDNVPISITSASQNFPMSDGDESLSNLNHNPVSLLQAYGTWVGIKNFEVSLGLLAIPGITAAHLYYKPNIGTWPGNISIGNTLHVLGNHQGVAIKSHNGPMNFSLSCWQATNNRKVNAIDAMDEFYSNYVTSVSSSNAPYSTTLENLMINYDAKSLRLGYAGRLSFAPQMTQYADFGFGIGYSHTPLSSPLVMATFGYAGDNLSLTNLIGYAPIFSLTTYNALSQFALDVSLSSRTFQINAGFQRQTLKADVHHLISLKETMMINVPSGSSTQYTLNASTQNQIDQSNIMNVDGKSMSFWLEAGFLLSGQSYSFDQSKGCVRGIKMNYGSAMEAVIRVATEERKNILALLDTPGIIDFSSSQGMPSTMPFTVVEVSSPVVNQPTNTLFMTLANDEATVGSNNILKLNTDNVFYRTRTNGIVFNLNYYLTSYVNFKLEYEIRNNRFERMINTTPTNPSVIYPSISSKSVTMVRLRSELLF